MGFARGFPFAAPSKYSRICAGIPKWGRGYLVGVDGLLPLGHYLLCNLVEHVNIAASVFAETFDHEMLLLPAEEALQVFEFDLEGAGLLVGDCLLDRGRFTSRIMYFFRAWRASRQGAS